MTRGGADAIGYVTLAHVSGGGQPERALEPMTEDTTRPIDLLAGVSDAALMGRMRLGEETAFREFMRRFAPGLRDQLAQYAMLSELGTSLIPEVLDDVAWRIRNHGVRRKGPLAPYLWRVLRNRLLYERRRGKRLRILELSVSTELEGNGQAAILATCSSHALGSAQTPDAEVADESAARAVEEDPVRALHDHVVAAFSEEDRRILGWLSERVPQREIAEWIGTTYGAMRVRIHRLRTRAEERAAAFVARMEPKHRAALERAYLGRSPRVAPLERRASTPRDEWHREEP